MVMGIAPMLIVLHVRYRSTLVDRPAQMLTLRQLNKSYTSTTPSEGDVEFVERDDNSTNEAPPLTFGRTEAGLWYAAGEDEGGRKDDRNASSRLKSPF